MKVFVWILAALLGLVIALLGLIYFLPGYDMYIVRSDSMKPAFSSGDVVITVPPDSLLGAPIQPGSIVTFDVEGNRITHRISSISSSYVVTKGDANKDPDAKPISISQISGIYLLKVPYVGYLNVFVRTKLGWFLVIILPTISLVSLIIKDIIKEALNIRKTANKTNDIC